MSRSLLLLSALLFLSVQGFCQNVGINETGALPDSSAMLDVDATDKGVLIPRTDTGTVNASGQTLAKGLLIYQLPDTRFYYYNGSKWVGIVESDDQTIDVLSYSAGNISISLEDDGQATQTVDISDVDTDTDDQTIDVLSFSGGNISISLEDDGQATQTLDISGVDTDTDDQTIDVLSFSGGNISISLEDDGQATQTLDISGVDTDTDDQTIDVFSYSSGTISLSLEDDGQTTQTVDISAVNTDNQKVDAFSLSGSTLSLSLEDDGEANKTVNLSGVNTDNQKVDAFSLSGSTLSLSLEDDGEANKTVNLSGVNTDNQKIDAFSLSGSTLSLSLEDDGEANKTIDFTDLLPVGSIIMYPSNTAPTNWLICDGSTFSSSTYPDLSSLLGGTTLPDFSGRFPLGVGNSGTSGSTNHSLGSAGGEETHTLTTSEMPSHSHGPGSLATEEQFLSDQDDGSGNQDARDGSDKKLFEYNGITGSTASTGGGNAHNNMPPYRTVNFIIKAK